MPAVSHSTILFLGALGARESSSGHTSCRSGCRRSVDQAESGSDYMVLPFDHVYATSVTFSYCPDIGSAAALRLATRQDVAMPGRQLRSFSAHTDNPAMPVHNLPPVFWLFRLLSQEIYGQEQLVTKLKDTVQELIKVALVSRAPCSTFDIQTMCGRCAA